ncbi:MAG: hypothetical protein U9P36_07750, partial [Thermodesulfobacteriota bacterium]|nr:hypothetical protein [Thermodesulfobacteriota bacterium]
FNGHNGLDFMDNLYNSISKGSAYFIPQVQEKAKKYDGTVVELELVMKDEQQAQQSTKLLESGGATVAVTGNTMKITGDLGAILQNALADSDAMYANDGAKLVKKYGYNERLVLYNWYNTLKVTQKNLNKQKNFEQADIVSKVIKRAVQVSYNYYTIKPQSIKDALLLVTLSLGFYVIYTLWYGFGIMYLFEGLGLKIGH